MVDVGAKPETLRVAVATGRIRMSPGALAAIRDGDVPKGDVLAAARISGIMAAKKTADLIPLCHPLGLDAATLDFAFEDDAVRATATASLTARTGVEMEAMTAVSIALLTIYDMAKAIDKAMVLEDIRLIEKRGGKSGDWRAAPAMDGDAGEDMGDDMGDEDMSDDDVEPEPEDEPEPEPEADEDDDDRPEAPPNPVPPGPI